MPDENLAANVAHRACRNALLAYELQMQTPAEPEPEPEPAQGQAPIPAPQPEPVLDTDSDWRPTLSRELKQCGHFCYPSNNPGCCTCMDARPVLAGNSYPCYVDGRGWVNEGARDDGYCPVCNVNNLDAWEKKMRRELAKKAAKQQLAAKMRARAEAAAAADEQRASAATNATGDVVTFQFSNGDVYHGQMVGGRPHGYGKMAYADDPTSERMECSLTT